MCPENGQKVGPLLGPVVSDHLWITKKVTMFFVEHKILIKMNPRSIPTTSPVAFEVEKNIVNLAAFQNLKKTK